MLAGQAASRPRIDEPRHFFSLALAMPFTAPPPADPIEEFPVLFGLSVEEFTELVFNSRIPSKLLQIAIQKPCVEDLIQSTISEIKNDEGSGCKNKSTFSLIRVLWEGDLCQLSATRNQLVYLSSLFFAWYKNRPEILSEVNLDGKMSDAIEEMMQCLIEIFIEYPDLRLEDYSSYFECLICCMACDFLKVHLHKRFLFLSDITYGHRTTFLVQSQLSKLLTEFVERTPNKTE